MAPLTPSDPLDSISHMLLQTSVVTHHNDLEHVLCALQDAMAVFLHAHEDRLREGYQLSMPGNRVAPFLPDTPPHGGGSCAAVGSNVLHHPSKPCRTSMVHVGARNDHGGGAAIQCTQPAASAAAL